MAYNRKLTKALGDYTRGFVSEDGKHYRTERQELSHAMKHVQNIRDKHATATRASNPNQWRHIGSIPEVVLDDWLNKHGYTRWHFTTNQGGDPYNKDPYADNGVRSRFLRYFLSRDFSKLHNMHVTTKRESSQILMPGDPNADIRRLKNSTSKLD